MSTDSDIRAAKDQLRTELKQKRAEIAPDRRTNSAKNALETLREFLNQHQAILSFASFGTEFDMWPINEFLAEQGKLLLPRVEGEKMRVFTVPDIKDCLEKHAFGFLEPIPEKCREVEASEIDLVLVPGLGFDLAYHRMGYGKRYYDHFLEANPKLNTYGVGFQEQLVEKGLPTYEHDVSLNGLFLF